MVVYPSVKVRAQEKPVSVKEDATSVLRRAVESLSLEDNCSPRIPTSNCECENGIYSPPSCARISKFHHKNFLTPPFPTSKVSGKKNGEFDEDNRSNIRASSVPRPRAVLSSPDNDEMIGYQNQRAKEKQGLQRRQSQGLHASSTLNHESIRVESPLKSRKVSKEAGNGNRSMEKQALKPVAPRPRATIRK